MRTGLQVDKKKVLIVMLLFVGFHAGATTYYTVGTGLYTAAIWSTVCSNAGTCSGSTLPTTFVDGDIIIIDDRVTINSGTWSIAQAVTVIIRTDISPNTPTAPAKLNFTTGGKLSLGAGSQVVLENTTGNSSLNPILDGTGSGASNQIAVGGVELWRASLGDISGVGVLGQNGTLPITLLSFTAKQLKNSVMLTWVTGMEKDFDYFQLERANSSLEFVTLTTIAAKGGLNFNTTYNYTDPSPIQGKNYYRLKNVDIDGTYKYSDVIMSDWKGGLQLNVYPNPANARAVTIEVNEQITHPIAVKVIEPRGFIVYQTQIELNSSVIDLPESLAAGHYLIRIQLSSGVQTIPVVLN